jgi:hypothetical protein
MIAGRPLSPDLSASERLSALAMAMGSRTVKIPSEVKNVLNTYETKGIREHLTRPPGSRTRGEKRASSA